MTRSVPLARTFSFAVYACHEKPQLGHRLGFLPASRESRPKGKKQMDTRTTHNGKKARCVGVLHFGQETVTGISYECR